jgi:hypothetical protein
MIYSEQQGVSLASDTKRVSSLVSSAQFSAKKNDSLKKNPPRSFFFLKKKFFFSSLFKEETFFEFNDRIAFLLLL